MKLRFWRKRKRASGRSFGRPPGPPGTRRRYEQGGISIMRKVISLQGKARTVFALLAMAAKRNPGKTLKEM